MRDRLPPKSWQCCKSWSNDRVRVSTGRLVGKAVEWDALCQAWAAAAEWAQARAHVLSAAQPLAKSATQWQANFCS